VSIYNPIRQRQRLPFAFTYYVKACFSKRLCITVHIYIVSIYTVSEEGYEHDQPKPSQPLKTRDQRHFYPFYNKKKVRAKVKTKVSVVSIF
jgi:hypothetical protein